MERFSVQALPITMLKEAIPKGPGAIGKPLVMPAADAKCVLHTPVRHPL